MKYNTAQLAQLADYLAPHGWTVTRALDGTYIATADDYTLEIGETRNIAGSHLVSMLAAVNIAIDNTTPQQKD